MTATETAFDSAKVEAFAGHLMSILSGSLLTGFGEADVYPAPGHPFDAVYVTRAGG